MRTKITVVQGSVVVERDHPIWGDRRRTVYSVPIGGGYVRDDSGRQVCDRLDCRGETLRSSESGLSALIRRELKRQRISEARHGL